MTFKIGDKVRVVENYDDHKVGETGTITSISLPYYRINGDSYGAPACKFVKVEDEPMYKVGDKVKVLNNSHTPNHYMVIGSIAEIVNATPAPNGAIQLKGEITTSSKTQYLNPKCFTKAEDEFEAEWILNNGKVTIPDDAHKLMDGGSVVAFRKRKAPPLEFGDKVMYKGKVHIYVRRDMFNAALVVILPQSGGIKSVAPNQITKV